MGEQQIQVGGEFIPEKSVKFVGVVKSYDTMKSYGMIACNETQQMYGVDIYAYKDVLQSAELNVGDTVRFGVHLNPKGQPQASLPVFKVGDNGLPIGNTGEMFAAEELAATDPLFLDNLRDAIISRSEQQNANRMHKKRKVDVTGWGGGGGGGGDAWGGGWGGDAWGGGKGGKGWGWQEPVDLFVGGVPPDASSRELNHIFRQYAGFMSLRMVHKDERMLVFVTFATPAQAQFVAEALVGYVFDLEVEPKFQTTLEIKRSQGKGCGKFGGDACGGGKGGKGWGW